MAGTSTHPIEYSVKAIKVQPLDWNAMWAIIWNNGTIELSDTVWDDQQVNLGTIRKGVSAPIEINFNEGYALAFVNGQSNSIRFNMQMSHRYKLDTAIEFHLHTSVTDNNAGDVRWQLKISYADMDGNFGNTATFLATQTIDANSQNIHSLFEINADVASFSAVSGICLCNITRLGSDGTDTYSGDIVMVALDAHMEIDTMGSREVAVK